MNDWLRKLVTTEQLGLHIGQADRSHTNAQIVVCWNDLPHFNGCVILPLSERITSPFARETYQIMVSRPLEVPVLFFSTEIMKTPLGLVGYVCARACMLSALCTLVRRLTTRWFLSIILV